MPDIVALITSQHRQVDELLEQAEQDSSAAPALLRKVADLLPVLAEHASAEELEELGNRFAAETGSSEVRPDALTGAGAPADGTSKTELYERAKDLDVPGRSTMTKEELSEAITENS